MSRPLILLPPSKGKAEGGDGPGYAATLDPSDPLTTPREQVLAAVTDHAPSLEPAELARLCGVPTTAVEAQRTVLEGLATAPTLPAHRRYTGIVHGNAGLAAVDPATAGADVRIVSALLGLVGLDEPVPAYRLEVAATLAPLGGLGPFWRGHLDAELRRLAGTARVWDLLPGEHARVWPSSARDGIEVVQVRFVRPDGRAANAARTKVCKGRLTAALLAAPTATPDELVDGADPGEGWTLRATGSATGSTVIATYTD